MYIHNQNVQWATLMVTLLWNCQTAKAACCCTQQKMKNLFWADENRLQQCFVSTLTSVDSKTVFNAVFINPYEQVAHFCCECRETLGQWHRHEVHNMAVMMRLFWTTVQLGKYIWYRFGLYAHTKRTPYFIALDLFIIAYKVVWLNVQCKLW